MMKNVLRSAARRRAAMLCSLGLLVMIGAASCAGGEKPSPVATAVPGAVSADQWLSQAAAAAGTMKNYAFELRMSQQLGPVGNAKSSDIRVDMQGKVERDPLKLDQTVQNNIDGEKSTLRSIVTPEAYYMYLPEYEEWSRLSKEVAEENAATLSEFQVVPEKAIERVRGLGANLRAERSGDKTTIRYEGNGQEANVFLGGLLRSTLGLAEPEDVIADKLKISFLKVTYNMDAQRNWPLSYRIETELTVELESGKPTPIRQTVAGSYSKPNAISAIVVPPDALQAPDPSEIEDLLGLGE